MDGRSSITGSPLLSGVGRLRSRGLPTAILSNSIRPDLWEYSLGCLHSLWKVTIRDELLDIARLSDRRCRDALRMLLSRSVSYAADDRCKGES